jgi:hypothetical protein
VNDPVGQKYLHVLTDSKPDRTPAAQNNASSTIPFYHLTIDIILRVTKMSLSSLKIDWTVMPEKYAEFSQEFPKHAHTGESEMDITKYIHHSKVCFLIQIC